MSQLCGPRHLKNNPPAVMLIMVICPLTPAVNWHNSGLTIGGSALLPSRRLKYHKEVVMPFKRNLNVGRLLLSRTSSWITHLLYVNTQPLHSRYHKSDRAPAPPYCKSNTPSEIVSTRNHPPTLDCTMPTASSRVVVTWTSPGRHLNMCRPVGLHKNGQAKP